MPQAGHIYDRVGALDGGMDSGLAPDVVEDNQTTLSIAATHRGGFIHPRPAFQKCALNLPNAITNAFNRGVFQTSMVYTPDDGPPCILALVGGSLYSVNVLDGFSVTDVTPADADFPTNRMDGYMVQAERWAVIQDGSSRPIIYESGSARVARDDEIKSGTVMVYAGGRIWYARPDGYRFRATDLVYTGGRREAVLEENENNFLFSGDFSVPAGRGRITAMAVPHAVDTSMGQGPVQVFTVNSVFSVNAPPDREQWQNLSYPIATQGMIGFGATGQSTTVVHNGDVFYRSTDGIRSYVLGRREIGGWGNTPISREIQFLINGDREDLLPFGSAVVWRNRLIHTALPVYEDLGIAHHGMVVLDFDLAGGLRGKMPSVWEGLWGGLRVLKLVDGIFGGVHRCFAWVRRYVTIHFNNKPDVTYSYLDLVELIEDQPRDKVVIEITDGSFPIQWSFVTGAKKFAQPIRLKKLLGGRLELDKIRDNLQVSVYYRPDGYEGWNLWGTYTRNCGLEEQCNKPACVFLKNYLPEYQTSITLGEPNPPCQPNVMLPMNLGRSFHF